MTAPLLRVDGVSVRYGRTEAVRDVSLTVARGERVALVGPNGAGKSSLLRAVAGLAPYEGSVLVHDRPCHHRRRTGRIAVVPQRGEIRWDFPITVGDVVATGRLGQRPRRRRAAGGELDVVLDRFGLLDLARHPIGHLSGGQQQRVLLARAIAQEPDLLLLDEPFAGLDAASVSATLACLAEASDSEVGVLAAVHELDIVRSAFPRTIALDSVLVSDGPTSLVLAPQGVESLFFTGRR